MKIACFILNVVEVSSDGSNKQYASIGSGNSSTLNRRQAIIWTNDGLDYLRVRTCKGDKNHWRTNVSFEVYVLSYGST